MSSFYFDLDGRLKSIPPRPRPWLGLQMRPLNVEKGEERYPPRAPEVDRPFVAAWRNNLVALSQRRNLLFIAYGSKIYVWEPSGFSQTLGSTPEMIITPVMKNPQARGYIAPGHPHMMNSILLDDLGTEEILLLATDSGNVCGYRVEAIYSALKRAAKSGGQRPFDDSVDPFFIEYVEASAWGLAVHKYARLIAVTANTGLITVFAFALVDPADKPADLGTREDDDLADYDQMWLEIKNMSQFMQLRQLMPDRHRTRNIKLTYTGHFTNIPSVSFYNCDLDPNGVWMVSTDIENKMILWNIWDSLAPFNIFHFRNMVFNPELTGSFNDEERGWAVLALDPRSFYPVRDMEFAFGGKPVSRGAQYIDLSDLSRYIPNTSSIYNHFPPAKRPELGEAVLPDFFGADCRIADREFGYGVEREGFVKDKNHAAFSPKWSTVPQDFGGAEDTSVSGGPVVENIRPVGAVAAMNTRSTNEHMNTDRDSPDNGIGNAPANPGIRPLQTRNPSLQGPLATTAFLGNALPEALGGSELVNQGQNPVNEVENDDEIYADEDDEDDENIRLNHTDPNDEDTDPDSDEIEALMEEQSDEEAEFHANIEFSRQEARQVQDQMLINAFGDTAITSENQSQQPTSTTATTPLPPSPAAHYPFFPILHFSQTDIRLVSDPFATHESVFWNAPLRQMFTYPIVSLRAADRFNMVKYIPEHGIVVAASQKGRAAVISLTDSKEVGPGFRVDWIVPFEEQERFGERPLIPLVGMCVGPVQGFEMSPDVPYTPRDVRPNSNEEKTTFHYGSSPQTNNTDPPTQQPTPPKTFKAPTLPESHAKASRSYRPSEPWRAWHPSRRYRLLMVFGDHTVLSYEFWYEWRSSAMRFYERRGGVEMAAGVGVGMGVGVGGQDDEIFGF